MNTRTRISLVGPSKRFLSGISYYTITLSNTLSEIGNVQAFLFRHMVPKKFFPGWRRVGQNLSTASFKPGIESKEMLDWYNPLSWMRAASSMRNSDVLIFQWWTSSVAHMYLALQLMLFRRVPIVIEYHEVVDPLEQSIMPLRVYSTLIGRIIRRFASHFVTHSEADRELIETRYHIPHEKISIIPLGLFIRYPIIDKPIARKQLNITEANVILFFGLLRPYKGVKYLIEAFDALPDELIRFTRLIIVGEAWEDQESLLRAKTSPNREKISIVNRYVDDSEIPLYFSAADVLVLPYTRASQSGVAPLAMMYGLPIIATTVGGLEEGVRSYAGAFFIPPENAEKLSEALIRHLKERGSYAPPAHLTRIEIRKQWASFLESIVIPSRKLK